MKQYVFNVTGNMLYLSLSIRRTVRIERLTFIPSRSIDLHKTDQYFPCDTLVLEGFIVLGPLKGEVAFSEC